MGKDIWLEADGKRFPVYVAEAIGEAHGTVILIEEIWGLNDHIKAICNRLAGEGFHVVSPNLLADTSIEDHVDHDLMEGLFDPERRSAVQPRLREIMSPINAPEFANTALAKLHATYEHVREKAGDRIAVMGFCFGGSYSYQLAVNEPRLKAAIPFYGHASTDVAELGRIKCPVLSFYGEQDANLMGQLPELKANMKTAGVTFEAVVYPNCGHAFFNDTNRFAYNAEAAKDAWSKTLEFLSANLAD